VTETLLSPSLAAALESVPAEWGLFSCQRLATATEMAATADHCGECLELMVAKVGGGLVQGTVIGSRPVVTAAWSWSPVLCRSCEIAHCIADGV
jgi:hypothetical protein